MNQVEMKTNCEKITRQERDAAILRHAFGVQRHEHTPRMLVKDLQAGTPVPRLELLVLRRYPRREVNTSRFQGLVAAACGRDETGVVGLVLWGEQVEQVRSGDVVRIDDGWCRMSHGELVVSSGRRGELSLITS